MNINLIKDQTFKIINTKFRLKEDLDLDEADEAGKLLNLFFSPATTTVIAQAKAADIKRFLSIVLEPADGAVIPADFNFGKIKEDEAVKVFLYFFLSRMKKGSNISKESAELIEQLTKQ